MRAPLLAALPLLLGCRGTAPPPAPDASRPHPAPRTGDPAELAAWLTGAFSSADQAAADPERYLDIRLFMVPIWTEAADGPWLYVEQAAAAALERPYRQRVYRLVETAEGVRSDVYTLPGDPLAMAGSWRHPEAFTPLAPADLELREGCSIFLERRPNAYLGSTRGEGCASRLADASFATSEVVVTPTAMTSWDRGFDADGRQVWGATEGPYVFERTSEL